MQNVGWRFGSLQDGLEAAGRPLDTAAPLTLLGQLHKLCSTNCNSTKQVHTSATPNTEIFLCSCWLAGSRALLTFLFLWQQLAGGHRFGQSPAGDIWSERGQRKVIFWLLPALSHLEGVTASLCPSGGTQVKSAWPLQSSIILVPQFLWCDVRALSLTFL